jgi:hypothetical protein
VLQSAPLPGGAWESMTVTATDQPQWQDPQHVEDFAPTEPIARDESDSRWWSEAADGRCSDDAAQFAASLPAPLSIV